ncbi:hypothetical protein Tco_0960669 [Tanacetum coccineum]
MGIIPTKTELALEQTQQGVSYEVSSDTYVFTMTMEILLEPTSSKLCGSCVVVKATYSYSKPRYTQDINQDAKKALYIQETLPQALIDKIFLKELQKSSLSRNIQVYLKAQRPRYQAKVTRYQAKDQDPRSQACKKELQENSQDHKAPRLKTSQEVKQ